MQHKFHFIYKTTCSKTGRYYVGMHSTNDMNDGYLGSGTHMTRSLRKHGREHHVREIIQFLPDRSSLKLFEKEFITTEMLDDPLCMNIAPGGGGGRRPGFKHTDETKAKIAMKNLARDKSVNTKISNTLLGRKNPNHSALQLERFANKSNHPRITELVLQSPTSEIFTFLGFEALHKFCKDNSISMQRLIKHRGTVVPDEKIQGGRKCSYNTIGWKLS